MRRAFTLIALLVAVEIIAVLGSLLMSVFGRVRQSAHETSTRSDLRQAWLALVLYREDDGDLPNTSPSASCAVRAVPVCETGNPWEMAGATMPSPTLGQFGYVRLTGKYRRAEDWEADLPEGHRYLLASIRFADRPPSKFEGDAPANPNLLFPGPELRFAYQMPDRILTVEDQGAVRTFDRPTTRRLVSHGRASLLITWPLLFE